MEMLWVLPALLLGVGVGWTIASFRLRGHWQRERDVLKAEYFEKDAACKVLTERLSAMTAGAEEQKQRMELEFRQLADRIFEDKSKRFQEMSGERLSTLLEPLHQNIHQFQKKVEDVYLSESRERFSLAKEVAKLAELNQQIGLDAQQLTQALKGESKVQGDWGEMLLEQILETSGLRAGIEYEVQSTLAGEDGKALRPDIVVHYPGERDVIIDAKVSLTAYIQAVSTEDVREKERYRKEHLRSVRNHIDELARKDYARYNVRSLEFVMMFVPNEPSYTMALQADPQLWRYAYDKKVVLMSPTNLVAALRMALDLWNRDAQVKNIQEIVKQGTALYEKFVGFSDNFDKVGVSLRQAQSIYQEAFRQLSSGPGNLVRRVENLKKLGLSPGKQIQSKFLTESEPEDDSQIEAV
jgi:DNA recombination protein RmuC